MLQSVERQTWTGVGASLTSSSERMLRGRPGALSLLYDPNRADGAQLNMLRMPLSATDFSGFWWSWGWDPTTQRATPGLAQKRLKNLTNTIENIRPDLFVVAVPWTAPRSMKTNRKLAAGELAIGHELEYSTLLFKQARWLLNNGIQLKAMSMSNEPFHEGDYPTMAVSDPQMIQIANDLAPKLARKGVELWAVEHNWEHRSSYDAVLSGAPGAFAKSAFHCYGGDPSDMTGVASPPVITECTGTNDTWENTFRWQARNLVVDALAAGSTGLMMWNLALDPAGGPKKDGGCENCRGLLEIDPATGSVRNEPEFYTLAHLARAADPGAVSLGTYSAPGVPMTSFRNPDGTIGVFGHNDTGSTQVVQLDGLGVEVRFEVRSGELFTLRGGATSTEPPSVGGSIAVSPDGYRYYIDTTGYRHFITTDAVFECHGGAANARTNVSWDEIVTYPETEFAECFAGHVGDIIAHPDGDAYVLAGSAADLERRWIPSASDYVCARAEGRDVVTVTRYHVEEIPSGPDRPDGTCIVRQPGGDSHFVNAEGRREWIPDAPTWDCEIGRGIRVLDVASGFVDTVDEVGWHYCLNKANLRGKVVRHTVEGDAHFIHPDDTRTWIPDGPTYACRTRQGTEVVETRWREYIEAFADTGWDYCYDINTLKNQIITHPDGDSHLFDGSGVRHWIPNTSVFGCLDDDYPVVEVRWRAYIDRTPEGEWAVCGATLTTWQRLDRGQSLHSSDGRYKLLMQSDGNLVLRNASNSPIWATNRAGQYAVLQGDGNLVVYNSSGAAVWNSRTVGSGGDRLRVQNDGNLVLYDGSRAVWSTGTVGG